MEIERKFLVRHLPDAMVKAEVALIEQSYLSMQPELRLRAQNNRYYLTVKGEGELAREEFEMEITRATYEDLSRKVRGLKIIKDRYLVPIKNYTAELDIFLIPTDFPATVEVEFPSVEAANSFVPPVWFGEDITNNPVYRNKNIAKRGVV